MLSRLERFPTPGEGRTPQASQFIGWATVYGTNPLRLLAPDALAKLEPQDQAVILRFAKTFEEPPRETVQDQAQPAPSYVGATGGADAIEGRIAVASRRALRFAATAEGSNVGPETIDGLHAEVQRLARLYTHRPATEILPDLIDTQDIAFRILEGRQRPTQAQDLYLIAGAVSAILAEASHHLGDISAARMQARAAFVCADNAGHEGLRAWVYGIQSLIAYWAGWPHEAVRYARLGRELPTHGTSSAWLPALEARAWASVGEAEATRDALHHASVAREQIRSDALDEFGGTLTFTRPRQLYYAADTTTWLPGHAIEAETQALEAISACEASPADEWSFATDAGSRAVLALSRVDLHQVDGAEEALQPVFGMEPARRVRGVVGTAQRIHAALKPIPGHRQTSAERSLQEEIEVFCQAPAGAALPRGR
jgi:hypothetical protein